MWQDKAKWLNSFYRGLVILGGQGGWLLLQ
jgi:hypothetical protein